MENRSEKNPEQAINEIIEHCKQEDAIIAVYLFCSAASGKIKPSSDLDLALLLESGSDTAFPMLKFSSDLEIISGRRIDLVILNRSGVILNNSKPRAS